VSPAQQVPLTSRRPPGRSRCQCWGRGVHTERKPTGTCALWA